MPQKAWNAKRERQYLHNEDSLINRGKPQPLAEEIAARVVNTERAQNGESLQASLSAVNHMPDSRRGSLRSHTGPGGRTVLQLRNEARQRGLKVRSAMNKAQLETAPVQCVRQRRSSPLGQRPRRPWWPQCRPRPWRRCGCQAWVSSKNRA